MRPVVRLVLAALLGLAVLAPTAAHAEKKTFSDARGDVQVYDLEVETPDDSQPPARPSRTEAGDLLRMAVSNTGDRVSVRARYAVIGRRVLYNAFEFVIVGSNGQRHHVSVDPNFSPEPTLTRGDEVKCRTTLRHRVDYRADTVSFSFPRSCIGSPQRLRVAQANAWVKQQDDTTSIVAYDIAGRDGGRLDRRWGFSPAVRHTR